MTMSGVSDISPADILSKRILVLAPHMDDEYLGCGGTMLMHEDKSQVFCLYATDGTRSPSPLLPWDGKTPPDIRDRRRREVHEVMAKTGVPAENLVFLELPDGRLSRRKGSLRRRLRQEFDRIRPAFVLAPFRYDLHSDHVALSDTARHVLRETSIECCLLEYFVYFRWRLIPGGDIRELIPSTRLVTVDTSSVNERKSSMIRLYRSQTELLEEWQDAPILTDRSIGQRCSQPEVYLVAEPGRPKSMVFASKRPRILLAHYVERYGKRPKDQAMALLRRLTSLPGTRNA